MIPLQKTWSESSRKYKMSGRRPLISMTKKPINKTNLFLLLVSNLSQLASTLPSSREAGEPCHHSSETWSRRREVCDLKNVFTSSKKSELKCWCRAFWDDLRPPVHQWQWPYLRPRPQLTISSWGSRNRRVHHRTATLRSTLIMCQAASTRHRSSFRQTLSPKGGSVVWQPASTVKPPRQNLRNA